MNSLFASICTFPVDYFPVGEVPKVGLGYEKNSLGYRGDDFAERADLNVLFLGDSWTQGAGVTEEETFARVACTKLADHYNVSVNNWNMGHGGKGYDAIARMLLSALPVLKPDIVFVTFPVMDRREYFTIDNDVVDIGVGIIAQTNRGNLAATPIKKDIFKRWEGLISPIDDAAKAIMSYKLIELLLNENDTMWGYCSVDWEPSATQMQELMKFGLFDMKYYLGSKFEKLADQSPTDGHPDVASHHLQGERIFNWLTSRYGKKLDEICRDRSKDDEI
ncbi:MAG: SGNH/GDSL hydrolase family protein [Rhodospirillaceae bacterium]|jgi:hypothetical protein|nr:SGNH/GDSL hydrolase family protein [Rhodospirillaceae bacterium]MBT4117734.1 SGNH/GDSL hydrolase family protein [Rhodospirillaceae bacterium]MBT4672802.1 SGNH/GDSL hydrolase family protein [Rhodospirillaceae bacterium]MBT5177474.1 SGNH/GDSL hydrolase family protein [Rhodospirillaceae bacterium]MBT5838552.1 SGNH/GDSL hydrolase family protein [Rhodospirillaceae bacterium]